MAVRGQDGMCGGLKQTLLNQMTDELRVGREIRDSRLIDCSLFYLIVCLNKGESDSRRVSRKCTIHKCWPSHIRADLIKKEQVSLSTDRSVCFLSPVHHHEVIGIQALEAGRKIQQRQR